jgi:hypothetical protein
VSLADLISTVTASGKSFLIFMGRLGMFYRNEIVGASDI